MTDLTHASFFSGAGGTDLGLEAAGWHTVSFSEIDPYASAVLTERWPGVPNLGDITRLRAEPAQRDTRSGNTGAGVAGRAGDEPADVSGGIRPEAAGGVRPGADAAGRTEEPGSGREQADAVGGRDDWQRATLWTGGFPCQDLSVAGKRRGFGTADARTRSGLAFAFLDLVAAHRPPIVLLENVPGLLSSNNGRDFRSLIDTFQELRYVGFYRTLDAQFFGVPQRRKRVFILAIDAFSGIGLDRAAEVLSVGTRCGRHPATGHEAGPRAASLTGGGADSPQSERVWGSNGTGPALDTGRAVPNVYNASARFGAWDGPDDIAGNLSQRDYKSSNHLVSTPSDADRVREADGLAGRSHDSHRVGDEKSSEIVGALRVGGATVADGGRGDVVPVIPTGLRASGNGNDLSAGDDGRLVHTTEMIDSDDAMLPPGLDGNRYRCCGNGVVAPVAEWLGARLASLVEAALSDGTLRSDAERQVAYEEYLATLPPEPELMVI